MLRYLSHAVFIASLIYSLLTPSFEAATLTLSALGYHIYESYTLLKAKESLAASNQSIERFDLAISELKDDVTKIKMAHGFKR